MNQIFVLSTPREGPFSLKRNLGGGCYTWCATSISLQIWSQALGERTGQKRGQVQGTGSWDVLLGTKMYYRNFYPPRRKTTLEIYDEILTYQFSDPNPFFHFCCNKYSPVLFLFLPSLHLPGYKYPTFPVFSLPATLQLGGWVAFPTRWVVWTLPRMVSADTYSDWLVTPETWWSSIASRDWEIGV